MQNIRQYESSEDEQEIKPQNKKIKIPAFPSEARERGTQGNWVRIA